MNSTCSYGLAGGIEVSTLIVPHSEWHLRHHSGHRGFKPKRQFFRQSDQLHYKNFALFRAKRGLTASLSVGKSTYYKE